MSRPVLPESRIHAAIRATVAGHHAETVAAVQAACERHALVVVGMAGNPFCAKARRQLDAAGLAFEYIGIGSYVGQWRQRTALKMWSGWPTLPMVFVKGMLVGGADDLAALLASGELRRLLG